MTLQEGKIEEIFLFNPAFFKFGDLFEGWKFATNVKFKLNISKIMHIFVHMYAKEKRHWKMRCEYCYKIVIILSHNEISRHALYLY